MRVDHCSHRCQVLKLSFFWDFGPKASDLHSPAQRALQAGLGKNPATVATVIQVNDIGDHQLTSPLLFQAVIGLLTKSRNADCTLIVNFNQAVPATFWAKRLRPWLAVCNSECLESGSAHSYGCGPETLPAHWPELSKILRTSTQFLTP